MDIGAIVLHKLLKEKSLEAWARVKLCFLDPSYSGLYTAINKHYNKYNCIPGFEDLEITTRDTPLNRSIASLKVLEVPDVDIDLAIDALIDNYTQNETLKLIDKFIDTVTVSSTQEIKDNLSAIVLTLDEKTHTSETIALADTMTVFEKKEDLVHVQFPLGFNNTFDATVGGRRQELLLIGGKRGSGKSVVCVNLCHSQTDSGNTVVYFTIEMTAKEVFERYTAVKSEVSHTKIRLRDLDFTDIVKIAKARAEEFKDADDVFNSFLEHRDQYRFEAELIKTKELKDNQLIIIDDRQLTLTAVDLHLQKIKAKHGDKFKLAVVDYLNQIVVPGSENDMYDWSTQIFISKKLKEFARKYDICIVSPYQIDDNGGTRFSKGILDAPDIAMLLDAHTREDGAITFESTKMRSSAQMKITSAIDWDTLRINPIDMPEPTKKLDKKLAKSSEEAPAIPAAKKTDDGGDVPW